MRLKPRYLLFGLCLSLVGASPARERAFFEGNESPAGTDKTMRALVSEEGGSFSHQAAGRRFEFTEGQVAVSALGSSWTYRFQGSHGGIRALSVSSLPEQTAPGSLQYRHSEGIIERYLVQSRGVEQQFVLPGPYAGGDVLLTGSVETDLVPEVTSSFEGIAFRRDESTVLFYGTAKAVDAAGKTSLLEERWSDGELTIVVPASFLAAARFPVLVDPYIGGRHTIDGAIDLAKNPAVATTNTSNFEALVVWSTDETSPQSIRGRIIGPSSNTIVGPIAVVNEFSGGGDYYTNPRVAWSPFDDVWVVAANGSPNGPNAPFIQVNKVSTAGVKTTGGNLNAPGDPERDVDVACNSLGQCLIVWAYDSNADATMDHIRGVFYTPGTNTFGAGFDFFLGDTVEHRHPRVASNGTDYYVVVAHGTTFVDGFSVTTGGVLSVANPSQSGTTRANPAVSYNFQLGRYLVAWDTGSTDRGSTLTGATPPVVSITDTQIAINATKPELTSQEYLGWTLAGFNSGGILPGIALVHPNLLNTTFANGIDAQGSVVSLDVAYFFRGLSILVYEDDRGSATDHDIRGREFRAPALEYADFDNNGNSSAFVWRSGSAAYFYFKNDLVGGTTNSVQFGTTGDIPVRTDFNGAGIPDLTVFRPSTGYWYTDTDRNGTVNGTIQFGAPGDIPVPGDYDGDGRTDLAVFRPSTGYWYILTSSSGFLTGISVQFGTSGDIPVPADYDGDYSTDIAVWRPSNGTWYVNTNLSGTVDIHAQFGTSGDIPVPGDYGPSSASGIPDGKAEFAVFRPSTGTWYVSRNRDGVVDLAVQFGTNGDIPVGGVYDNDPLIASPFAVFRPSNGTWYVDRDNNGTVDIAAQFGAAGDIPMQQPSGQYHN